jgi:uncharacterized RDD family membrane protein YckC
MGSKPDDEWRPAGEAVPRPAASGASPYGPGDYVGVGRRSVALLIDAFILSLIIAVFALPSNYQVKGGVADPTLTGVVAVLGLIYFVGMEGSQGATLGKMILRIRVTMEDGAKATWGAVVVRNLLRVVDGLFAYLVGAVFVWTSDKRQRLGDRAGKTVVVRAR